MSMEESIPFLAEMKAKPLNLIIPAALFYALIPGNLVTIPGAVSWVEMGAGYGNKSVLLTHAALFAIGLFIIKSKWPDYYN